MEPFVVVEPEAGEAPVVVEVPHAGLFVDAEALAFLTAPLRSLARDADLYMDELAADTVGAGATLLVARASRFVVDLNRAEDDVDDEAAVGGRRARSPRGVVWRLTTDGDPMLAAPLPAAELQRRLDAVYRPYHRALEALLLRKLARFGEVTLLCAHSMPTEARPPNRDAPRPARADLVPGTRGRTSAAPAVIDLVDARGAASRFSIRHDDPYRGGFTTAHYGRPDRGVHAVQVELARRLYMNEETHRRDAAGFRRVREFLRALVTDFAERSARGGARERTAP